MRPEAARERDLHRYYKPWKAAQSNLSDVKPDDRGNALGLTYEGYKPRTSGDKALTAFAQLATLRLDVRRAMVSLIDSHSQFIIAEATRTLSLLSDERHEPGDAVWLGNTIIKRDVAVCHHTFKSSYTATDKDGDTYTTEALVVPDMRLDDRFKDRPYVDGKPGVLFYAGVPIKAKSGHRIGVYAVSDDKVRDGLSVDELVFMEDVAATVMDHLELAKDRDALLTGERMVQGLADFIEGSEGDDPAIGTGANLTVITDASAEEQKTSPKMSAVMRQQTENAKKMLDELDDISDPPRQERAKKEPKPSKAEPTVARSNDDDTTKILARAARIIRLSTEADGVAFFNTGSRNLQGLLRRGYSADQTDMSSGLTSGDDKANDPTLLTDSGEEQRAVNGGTKTRRSLCEVMGLSVNQQEQCGRLEAKDFVIPADSMERYIKRYPHGKYFGFTDTGSGISSGDEMSSEDKAEAKPTIERPEARTGGKKDHFGPTELLQTLPGIRSLIFLPLWDFSDAKYFAGCFIWTSATGRLLSPENELPYLKAFGNCVMSEISRVKAERSDIAKSTFIASISHELRSPLHGILGSVEFLHETAVSAYQEGLFTSIETCGRTLLDTIDHVLDYAKINKLRKTSAGKRRAYARQGHKRDKGGSIVGLTTEFDLAVLVEEVVDAVTAGHAFRRTHQSTALEDGSANLPSEAEGSDQAKSKLDPIVVLKIMPRLNWCVRTQPGALRRIVMNLLGNALKYTDTGFVSVTLTAESDDQNNMKVRLRFIDSGRGMSLEFQRTRLFSPFSQEDPFATGTGLGLSIVRKIIEALGGDISITSTQNLGTEVNVLLTLPNADLKSEQSRIDPEACSTKDTKMAIVNPIKLGSEIGVSLSDTHKKGFSQLKEALHDEFKEWFGMNVVECSKPEMFASGGQVKASAPDFMLFLLAPPTSDALLKWQPTALHTKASAPVIVMCSNAAQASDFRANVAGKLLDKGIQAIPITQPLGPRKLANIFSKVGGGRRAQAHNAALDAAKQRIVLGRKESDPESMRRERDKLQNPTIAIIATERKTISRSLSAPTASPTLGVVAAPTSANELDVKGSSRPHILLVDDNAINLKLLVMFIKKQNIAYETANDGLVALETYKSGYQAAAQAEHAPPPFTHILMDLSMPVMDGLTSTRKIRAFEAEKNIWPPSTIIALTGLASAEAQEDALSAGINNFLVKPVKFGELKQLLSEPGGS